MMRCVEAVPGFPDYPAAMEAALLLQMEVSEYSFETASTAARGYIRLHTRPGSELCVIQYDESVIAAAAMRHAFSGRLSELQHIAVRPDHREHGHGRTLVRYATQRALHHGNDILMFTPRTDREGGPAKFFSKVTGIQCHAGMVTYADAAVLAH